MRPSQAVEIVGNLSPPFGTLAIRYHPWNILRISSHQGNPSVGELNTRGVVKYTDFGPIEGYISETVVLVTNRNGTKIDDLE